MAFCMILANALAGSGAGSGRDAPLIARHKRANKTKYTQTGPNGHATAGLETTLAMPCGVSTTARQDLLSQGLLKSAPLLCLQASAVALAFFMAFLMARPFMAFITLLTSH